jgi:hypothetical protein
VRGHVQRLAGHVILRRWRLNSVLQDRCGAMLPSFESRSPPSIPSPYSVRRQGRSPVPARIVCPPVCRPSNAAAKAQEQPLASCLPLRHFRLTQYHPKCCYVARAAALLPSVGRGFGGDPGTARGAVAAQVPSSWGTHASTYRLSDRLSAIGAFSEIVRQGIKVKSRPLVPCFWTTRNEYASVCADQRSSGPDCLKAVPSPLIR